MKRPLKQIFLLFFAISITISIVDYMLVDEVSFHKHLSSSRQCSELPTHADDTHLNHFDDVFYFGSEIQSNKNVNHLELVSALSADLKSKYLTCIWQPPKRS
jgi:hypothetical protein